MRYILISVLLAGALFSKPTLASDHKLQFDTGIYQGCTSYQIGGVTDTDKAQTALHFPVSDLKFPLNVSAGTLSIGTALTDRLYFDLKATKNISTNAGKLEDSDWLKRSSKDIDIFSESDAALNLFDSQAKFLYKLNSIYYPGHHQIDFYWGLGYRYQNFGFEASDLHQWYPSEPEKDPVFAGGKVITYSVTNRIPFWEFSVLKTIGSGTAGVSYGYSPNIEITDRDDHLLRSKLAVGNLTGQANFWNLNLRFPLTKYLNWNIKYSYQLIQAYGKQEQSRYEDTDEGKAGHIATLDQKVNSEQSLFLLGFEYQPKSNSNPSAGEKQIYTTKDSKVKRTLGFSYLQPLAEREGSFGPQLELETSRVILGISFHKGNNKVQTLSKGVYSMIPIYGLWKRPLLGKLTFLFGGGYCFNSNEIDPEAVSLLEAKGFPNSKETVSSSPMLMVGAEVDAPYSQGTVKCSLRYSHQRPTVTSKGDVHENSQEIDLSHLELVIRIDL